MKKNVRRLIILFICIIIIGTFTVINKSKDNVVKTDKEVTIAMLGQAYSDRGVLFNKDGIIKFTDINSGVTTVLCDKPNCKHNSEACNAVVGNTDILAIYNNKLYFIQSVDGEKTLSKFLFQADLNGGNRKRVAEIKNTNVVYKAKFTNNKLVLSTIQTNDENTMIELENQVARLISVDLNNYVVDYIFKVDKSFGNIADFKYIKEDNEIFFYYEYNKLQKTQMDIVEDGDVDNIIKNTVSELYSYDINSKKVKLIKGEDSTKLNLLSENKVLFIKNTKRDVIDDAYIYNYKDDTKKKVELLNSDGYFGNSEDFFSSIYDNTNGETIYYYFDIDNGKNNKLISKEASAILGISSNYIYISMENKHKEPWVYAIPISDFIKSDLSKAKSMVKLSDL